MSSTHVGVDRKSGRPDEALGMSVLNQVQMYEMKNGVVDEKQSIILTENTVREKLALIVTGNRIMKNKSSMTGRLEAELDL